MVKRSHRQRETLSDLTNGVEIVVIAHVTHCEVSRRVMLKSNAHEIAKLPLHEAALGCMAAGDGRAWPGFEPTRRAKARSASGERAGRRTQPGQFLARDCRR